MGTYSDSHPFKRGIFLLCIAWMVVAVGSLVMVNALDRQARQTSYSFIPGHDRMGDHYG